MTNIELLTEVFKHFDPKASEVLKIERKEKVTVFELEKEEKK